MNFNISSNLLPMLGSAVLLGLFGFILFHRDRPWARPRANPDGSPRHMRRSKEKWVGGVAGGIAAYYDIDPTLIRALFLIGLFTGAGFGLYLLLWIIMPEHPKE